MRWLIAHSIAILRVSLGAVFLVFGLLKFFPGVSPAKNLVEHTTDCSRSASSPVLSRSSASRRGNA